ncbi:hypothetical protein SADUNF_Sadunf08G0148200 [Salix dunnii]|uniref:Uncharacterized protein n=1 Tax=Salix dunnii TaxID=1413687 RepID=A0A835MY85_9ROSI|nr:hypothetical protein SADUNF_Sadunf08G0148200 [Salix dunnii]
MIRERKRKCTKKITDKVPSLWIQIRWTCILALLVKTGKQGLDSLLHFKFDKNRCERLQSVNGTATSLSVYANTSKTPKATKRDGLR